MKILRLLLLLPLLLPGCTAYENTVSSRSVGAAGAVTPEGGEGKLIYTVHYR